MKRSQYVTIRGRKISLNKLIVAVLLLLVVEYFAVGIVALLARSEAAVMLVSFIIAIPLLFLYSTAAAVLVSPILWLVSVGSGEKTSFSVLLKKSFICGGLIVALIFLVGGLLDLLS